jgi:hypothetical protein
MARETRAGAYVGPSVTLAMRQYLGKGVSIKEIGFVDYLAPTQNITMANIKRLQIGGTYELGGRLGAEFKVSRKVTLSFGGGYQYTLLPDEFMPLNVPVSVYNLYSTLRLGRVRLEAYANFQPDKIGTEKWLGVNGVASFKGIAVYDIPTWTIKK